MSESSEKLHQLIKEAQDLLGKHFTAAMNPKNPKKNPGDPKRNDPKKGPHHEPMAGPMQNPHGRKLGAGKQTKIALLRRAADLFGDDSIPSWRDMNKMTPEQIEELARKKFPKLSRMLNDAMPTRGQGNHLDMNDIPENIMRQFYDPQD